MVLPRAITPNFLNPSEIAFYAFANGALDKQRTPILSLNDPLDNIEPSMERKYTPEQLAAEIARPRKLGGRPRKYATEEDRRRANAEISRRSRMRKKTTCPTVNGSEITPRRQTYTTDDERQEAHRQQNRRYYYAHKDEYTLRRAANRRIHT